MPIILFSTRPLKNPSSQVKFEAVSFTPKAPKKKKKKKGGRKKNTEGGAVGVEVVVETKSFTGDDPMMQAVTAGWEPGAPFSFEAKCKGQSMGMDAPGVGDAPSGGVEPMLPTSISD